jgi:hypothetical protein
MVKLVNRAKVVTTTTGTGTITLGVTVDGFQSFTDAGVADGDVVRYVIEDGSNFEIGTGTFDATGGTLTRTPSESTASGSQINLSGDAVVYVSAINLDLRSATGGGSDEVFFQNDQTVTTNYTIPADKNALSTGPITINAGVTVTVSTGARYVVI